MGGPRNSPRSSRRVWQGWSLHRAGWSPGRNLVSGSSRSSQTYLRSLSSVSWSGRGERSRRSSLYGESQLSESRATVSRAILKNTNQVDWLSLCSCKDNSVDEFQSLIGNYIETRYGKLSIVATIYFILALSSAICILNPEYFHIQHGRGATLTVVMESLPQTIRKILFLVITIYFGYEGVFSWKVSKYQSIMLLGNGYFGLFDWKGDAHSVDAASIELVWSRGTDIKVRAAGQRYSIPLRFLQLSPTEVKMVRSALQQTARANSN